MAPPAVAPARLAEEPTPPPAEAASLPVFPPLPAPEAKVTARAAKPPAWPEASSPPASPRPAEAFAPGIQVLRTVWHPVPGKRIAYVSANSGPPIEIHEGDTFQGLEVGEIGLSSVVFESDGQRVTRAVGASP